MRQQADDTIDADLQIGLYGTATQPAFVVLTLDTAMSLDDSSLNQFASGMAGGGASVDIANRTHETRDGIEYVCTPVGVQGTSTTVCLWNDHDTTGIVLSLDQVITGDIDLAQEIHGAVVT